VRKAVQFFDRQSPLAIGLCRLSGEFTGEQPRNCERFCIRADAVRLRIRFEA
jgi:hypothetical protein